MKLPMSKRRQPLPENWYKSREAIILFILLGLAALALLAGLILLIVRHPLPALYTAGGLAGASASGYGIYRAAEAVKWKRDLARLDEAAAALKLKEQGKTGKEE